MSSLQNIIILSVLIFSIFTFLIVVKHEYDASISTKHTDKIARKKDYLNTDRKEDTAVSAEGIDGTKVTTAEKEAEAEEEADDDKEPLAVSPVNAPRSNTIKTPATEIATSTASVIETTNVTRRGKLVCNGKSIDSEIIYWKIVPGDSKYESPITLYHGNHDDRYLTFEYDQGGWNNVRMSLECNIIIAHATGRTLVIPPQQHLYLLGQVHQDKEDKDAHDEMGFEDFFSIDQLRTHEGMHIMDMEDFLKKEALTGGLKGIKPDASDIWGPKLWSYLDKVADVTPEWAGKFLALPLSPHDNFNLTLNNYDEHIMKRMSDYGGERKPVYYEESIQKAHHLHFPADHGHRLLQHFYAFVFFADSNMQVFYKRFIRDYMRYKDNIQCLGHELIQAVRADSLRENPENNGEYYALHIRRGDFQYKEVKLSAAQILKNLVHRNDGESVEGQPIIPPGSFVYISTDDPDGVCNHCYAQRKPCESYPAGKKPVGCQEDSSWDAFREFGWKIRFLKDYTSKGTLKGANPNLFGMIESIVCSRAKVFAGTFHSTFTGYIHRLRGYHGLGEETYYHSNGITNLLRMKKSLGHGFSREYRHGWIDIETGMLI